MRLCFKCLWNSNKPILRTIFILYWLLLAKLFISFTSERKCNLCTKMYSCNLTTLREFFTFIGIVKISINWQWVSWSYYREYITCKTTYSVAMLSWPLLPFQVVVEFLLTQIIQLKQPPSFIIWKSTKEYYRVAGWFNNIMYKLPEVD